MKKTREIAIKLTDVSKKYIIHHDKPTLAERLLYGKGEEFWALKNINLEIQKGERVGIIGANGSGKTTLLKLISGISNPTEGKVETYGKIVSLIDLEAGFHADLTGIQNIYLNGMILGMSKSEINDKLSEIIKFADIGKFIDAQLFTYSEGMKLRLGFSIAVNSSPNILVLDENMASGDKNFNKKSYLKIKGLLKSGVTFILVSHAMDYIKKYCSKTIILKNGIVFDSGTTKKIISKYLKQSFN